MFLYLLGWYVFFVFVFRYRIFLNLGKTMNKTPWIQTKMNGTTYFFRHHFVFVFRSIFCCFGVFLSFSLFISSFESCLHCRTTPSTSPPSYNLCHIRTFLGKQDRFMMTFYWSRVPNRVCFLADKTLVAKNSSFEINLGKEKKKQYLWFR